MSTLIEQLTHKDAFIDAFNLLYHNAIHTKTNKHQDNIHKFMQLFKPVYHDLQRTQLSLKDFKIMNSKCAIGAFGKVTIVQHQHHIYALKTSRKSKLIHQSHHSSPMEERLILSHQDPWLPSLYASFQDEKNLYLVMEYAPGGDLQGLMERRQYQPFTEHEAKFYIAELVLAIERVHQLGYIHRDIKPGNILIDKQGHIKLGDLGSCISIHTKENLSMVGTIPYASPEMSNSEGHDDTKGPAYGTEVDWWSVGIILYELLFGEPPFTGSNIQIQMSLLNPKVTVQFNQPIQVSYQAKDLISKLLTKSKQNRLCHVEEIKAHPFFRDIQWDTLRTSGKPPFVPTIVSPDDATFFSATEEEDDDDDDEGDDYSFIEGDYDLFREYPFIGYTYTQEAAPRTENQEFLDRYRQKTDKQCEEENAALKERIRQLEASIEKQHEEKNEVLKQRYQEMEKENKALKQQQQDTRRENEILKQQCQDLKKENETLKQQCQDAFTESERAKSQSDKSYQVLMRENKDLKFQSEMIAQDVESMKRHIKLLEETVQEHEQSTRREQEKRDMEGRQLLARYEKLKEERDELERLSQEMKQQVSEAQRQSQIYLEERDQLLEQKKISQLTKSLPAVPPRVDHSPEGRSILSAMWQRDKESLKHVQQALEASEGQLAYTKKQVLRLKREIKCLQTYTFEQEMKIPETSHRDKEIMEQIEKEKNFIKVTEKTIAARTRLTRNSDFDKELQVSLERAHTTISTLEKQLKTSHRLLV